MSIAKTITRKFFAGLDDCACCGKLLVLPPVYVEGAFHCGPCSRSDHRHWRGDRAA